jgi:hypothetical protein
MPLKSGYILYIFFICHSSLFAKIEDVLRSYCLKKRPDAFFGLLRTGKGNPELAGDGCLGPAKDGSLDLGAVMLCVDGCELL